MPEITLYQYEISPYVDKVRRVLKLKSLDYKTEEVLASKAKKWKHISPTLKFPAMKYDDQIIVDSTDIISFLNQKHPEPQLIPDDAKIKALAHILEDWADESLYFFDLAIRSKKQNIDLLVSDISKYETGFSKKMMTWVLPMAARKIAHTQGLGRKSTATLSQEIEQHFASLNELLNGSAWLVGDHLSTADIAVASMLHVLVRAKEPEEAVPCYENLIEWKRRIDALTL